MEEEKSSCKLHIKQTPKQNENLSGHTPHSKRNYPSLIAPLLPHAAQRRFKMLCKTWRIKNRRGQNPLAQSAA
jgi:hypothetical protein